MKFKLKKDLIEDFVDDEDGMDLDDVDDSLSDDEEYIGQKLIDFFTRLVEDSLSTNVSEKFSSENALISHFDRHCIASHADRESTERNVYYDFTDINEYRLYDNKIAALVSNTDYDISSLFDIERCQKFFRKLFEGGITIRFNRSCGIYGNYSRVTLGIHSFSSDVATNYDGGNTLDIIVLDAKGLTSTIYPIDAHYFETKINNIFSRRYFAPKKRDLTRKEKAAKKKKPFSPHYEFNND